MRYMTDLDNRIGLLRSSGVISEAAERKARLFCSLLLEEYGIALTEENAAACVTHLCMALKRMETDEDIAPMDAMVREDLKDAEEYDAAVRIAEHALHAVGPLMPGERDYLILHMVMVLSKLGGENS